MCPAHGPPGDLTDLVLHPSASVRSLVHGPLVRLKEKRRGIGSGRNSLPLPYLSEILIMLAGPVDVDTARDAVPLLVRSFRAALGALHGPIPGIASGHRPVAADIAPIVPRHDSNPVPPLWARAEGGREVEPPPAGSRADTGARDVAEQVPSRLYLLLIDCGRP
jgi:hypothetical protein